MWPIVEWISTIARLSAVSTGMRHERFMLSFAIDSVIERQDGFGWREKDDSIMRERQNQGRFFKIMVPEDKSNPQSRAARDYSELHQSRGSPRWGKGESDLA